MTQEQKDLLIKDLCARLPYKTDIQVNDWAILTTTLKVGHISRLLNEDLEIKPYLFPLSSMTEEQAKELSILYGIKDILSIKITDEYIDFEVDDGFCSIERKTIWYDEIISSIETFDWLNKNHFDYRGLIEKDLAIDATNLNIY